MSATLSTEEQRDLAERYQRLREEIDSLYNRLATIDGDRSEHDLVLKQLSALDGARRCWHQVGAALTEKTVAEIVPVLKTNRGRLAETVTKLTETVQSREKELSEMTKKYGIREVGASAAAAAQ